jgi:2-oxoglutarate ferredoxin oxidoreductase subunit alpha
MILPQSAAKGEASVPKKVVNDFTITFSTVNGSGSATANLTLMRALFKMGLPVSGKNIFPSNIKGQPTWFTIRVNKDGFLAYKDGSDIIIAVNPITFSKEQEKVLPGGVLFYSDDIKGTITREDIYTYPMPIKKLAKEADIPTNLRDYIENIVYIGIVAQILGVDISKIYDAFDYQFHSKKKPIDSNFQVVIAAVDWAKENLVKRDPFWIEPMNKTQGMILGSGNSAAALGTIFGGVQFSSWYPITPGSSIQESLNEYLPQFRKDPETGKATYAIVQAEDEISAIGMTIGAGWAGLRAMTATSGPGLSLMAEYLGLAYYAEIPIVVWDVQRVGPSTGLPTRTAQGDITFANFISHGDTRYILLFPATLKECFEFGWQAFDMAEHFQTPVIILSDLDLGMNYWISNAFEYPDKNMDRGKVLWEDDLEEMLQRRAGDWGRYLDIDGDGIPYRTLPGNEHPKAAYFGRGTGHDAYGRYSEDPEDWDQGIKRLNRKFETAKSYIPRPIINTVEGADIGIIGCGTTDDPILEARHLLAKQGIATDYLRVRAIPFTFDVADFIRSHKRNYIVELNSQGQLKQLLTFVFPDLASRLRRVAHIDGMPFTAKRIINMIIELEA